MFGVWVSSNRTSFQIFLGRPTARLPCLVHLISCDNIVVSPGVNSDIPQGTTSLPDAINVVVSCSGRMHVCEA